MLITRWVYGGGANAIGCCGFALAIEQRHGGAGLRHAERGGKTNETAANHQDLGDLSRLINSCFCFSDGVHLASFAQKYRAIKQGQVARR